MVTQTDGHVATQADGHNATQIDGHVATHRWTRCHTDRWTRWHTDGDIVTRTNCLVTHCHIERWTRCHTQTDGHVDAQTVGHIGTHTDGHIGTQVQVFTGDCLSTLFSIASSGAPQISLMAEDAGIEPRTVRRSIHHHRQDLYLCCNRHDRWCSCSLSLLLSLWWGSEG